MQLLERDDHLYLLTEQFRKTSSGEGHCFFITGEPGIGKTSLVREFLKEVESVSIQYTGSCDLLFTPRPLAPLYDIASQMGTNLFEGMEPGQSRSELFLQFASELSNKEKTVVAVFEDVHWADEATLDFIKFFARRINRSRCIFILTWRDDDVYGQHPLRNVLGHLVPGTFTRISLSPLSLTAVEQLAAARGYDAHDVFSISGGNPFFVNEILAHYSHGIPENIKDAVLSIYQSLSDETKETWQLLSVIPEGLEFHRFKSINDDYPDTIANCMAKKILILKNDKLFFKHELYRRIIEEALSPFKRIELNKKILGLFLETFETGEELERIVQYAKNANEYDIVFRYAPVAAKKAAALGAHAEAAKLYLTAIEYYIGNDKEQLSRLYESYAYECHLTNQVKEAIIYQQKALKTFNEKGDEERSGNCCRFLSLLWWLDGNRKKAEHFATLAVQVLENCGSAKALGMAYSNMASLALQGDNMEACKLWGEKALAIAKNINDAEITIHALNNTGSAVMLSNGQMQQGIDILQQSITLSLQHSNHEYVARGYASLGSNAVALREYAAARIFIEEGLNFCERKDIDSVKLYMLSCRARLNLETGNWKEACEAAEILAGNEYLFPTVKINALLVLATIRMRKGNADVLPLLQEAKDMAFKTMELRRMLFVTAALLEYEWITGASCIYTKELDDVMTLITERKTDISKSHFLFWLKKIKPGNINLQNKSAAVFTLKGSDWEKTGCPYEAALILFEGNEEDKRKALTALNEMGADAVYEKLKQEMRLSGIRNIPRGIRRSTRENPALLTGRELDVLTLLQEGIQNREIAGRLYISPKTVDHHISSILTKLDVNSRAKAVAEALRMGILK